MYTVITLIRDTQSYTVDMIKMLPANRVSQFLPATGGKLWLSVAWQLTLKIGLVLVTSGGFQSMRV